MTDQNWFAVFIDFLIVVVGILIAFQITKWNEARQESLQAKHTLDRLEQDFTRQLAQIDRGIRRHKQYFEATGRLVEGIRQGTLDEEKLIVDVEAAGSATFALGHPTAFQELVSSGKTYLVEDETLRNSLYEYNDYVSFFREEYSLFTGPIVEANKELLPAKTLLISGILTTDLKETSGIKAIDSSILLGNPNILNALKSAYMAHDNIHYLLTQFHNRIELILTKIDAEQRRTQ
ncbi:MAG: DUF6090 family protein [Gammaproteobacteria bacterium]